MIISQKHKFIFFKNRKTAGSSVEISLSKLCGSDDIITPLTKEDDLVRSNLGLRGAQNYHQPKNAWTIDNWLYYIKNGVKPQRFYNHIPCREVTELVSKEVWDSYFKFTFERNPFDKVVSFFYWRKANKKYKQVSDFILDGGLDDMQSFDLYSIGKIPVVDKIYLYEELSFFEKDLTERLNLAEPFKLVDYKAKSYSRHVKDYRHVLDDKAVNLIKIAFAREIELFGYEF